VNLKSVTNIFRFTTVGALRSVASPTGKTDESAWAGVVELGSDWFSVCGAPGFAIKTGWPSLCEALGLDTLCGATCSTGQKPKIGVSTVGVDAV